MNSVFLEIIHPMLIERTIWTRERSQAWWHGVMNGLWGENWWRKNLRMKKEPFICLCDELRPHISKCTTINLDQLFVLNKELLLLYGGWLRMYNIKLFQSCLVWDVQLFVLLS